MNLQKRTAMIFLSAVNIMNLAAGIITEMKIALGSDVISVIPISTEMTVNQILLLNFAVVVAIMLLINIVTAYLVTDIAYSLKEIISNCAGIFMVIPILVLFAAVFNAINAEIAADKVWIILSGVFYIFASAVNFGCILTIKEDSDAV